MSFLSLNKLPLLTKSYLTLKSEDSTISMEKKELETEEAPHLKVSGTYSISLEWEEAVAQEVDAKGPKKANPFLNH